ncbi:MAG: cation diffusion facilitator family transporter [Leptospirales bacterium]
MSGYHGLANRILPASPLHILSTAFFVNMALALLKIVWGHRIHSVGMLADGYHALIDSASDLLCLLGSRAASRPPDSDHPYGHFKYEPLTQAAVGLLLFFTGYEVLSHSYDEFVRHLHPHATLSAGGVMGASILLQTLLYLGEQRVVRMTGDGIVGADAAHIRSDLLASGAVLVGLFLSAHGLSSADPIVGILIAGFIAYAGYNLLREGTQVLSDTSPLPPEEIGRIVATIPGVVVCHTIRARGSKNRITMDLTVDVPGEMTVRASHEIADRIEDLIRTRYPAVVDVVVHIEPDKEDLHASRIP